MDKGGIMKSERKNHREVSYFTLIADSWLLSELPCETKLLEASLAHMYYLIIHTFATLTTQVVIETGFPFKERPTGCGECGQLTTSSHRFLQGGRLLQRVSPPKVSAHTWWLWVPGGWGIIKVKPFWPKMYRDFSDKQYLLQMSPTWALS